MARVEIVVDKRVLVEVITNCEASSKYDTRSALWADVAAAYNQRMKPTKDVTPSVVYLRVKQWAIPVKTEPGKRGGGGPVKGGTKNRTPRAKKFAANPDVQDAFSQLRASVPERFLPMVDRVEKGSRTAAVQLHCLECSGWMTSEVRQCGVQGCALWAFRPYQGATSCDGEDNGDVDGELDDTGDCDRQDANCGCEVGVG